VCARAPSLISVREPVGVVARLQELEGVEKRRDKTGLEKEMKTLYVEGLANHGGPEPWKAPDNRHEDGNGRVLR